MFPVAKRGRHRSSGSRVLYRHTTASGRNQPCGCVGIWGEPCGDLLSAGGQVTLEGVFGGHSMIFLLAVVGTAKPLEESSGVLLLFLQGLGSAGPPQGSPVRWGCSGSRAGLCPGWAFAGPRRQPPLRSCSYY